MASRKEDVVGLPGHQWAVDTDKKNLTIYLQPVHCAVLGLWANGVFLCTMSLVHIKDIAYEPTLKKFSDMWYHILSRKKKMGSIDKQVSLVTSGDYSGEKRH